VHEMTHALIEFDFPKVPCWFNEGFASLFEQCSTAGGKIRGLVNWRLPLLQRAIGDKSVLTWKKLCEYTGRDFYGTGRGCGMRKRGTCACGCRRRGCWRVLREVPWGAGKRCVGV